MRISKRFKGRNVNELVATLSQAGLAAKSTALVDAKRIADYIQGQKKEEEARRARERES